MGNKGPKASNIYQNPGIKNNPGKNIEPSIKGIGSPLQRKNLTKNEDGTYTKRKDVSSGDLGFGTKENRQATAESAKSYGAEIGAGVAASALGLSAGAGVGAMMGAAGARTAGNLVQNKIAQKRVDKYGQEGSAIVPNKTYNQGGEGEIAKKAFMGEKTYTGENVQLERKKARHHRKTVNRQARMDNRNANVAQNNQFKKDKQSIREQKIKRM